MKLASNRVERLPRKRLLPLGIALALSATPFAVDAAGLGRLNVLSSIGQPLRAEIELTAVTRDDAPTLSARLASPDAFAQANIDYGSMLNSLRFSVQRRGNGLPYVLVTSSQSINEPFLDVLVELNWGAGRLVREYTLLIDPVDAGGAPRSVEPGPTIVQAQGPTAVSRSPAPPPASRRAVAETDAPAPAAPIARTPVARAPAAGAGDSGEYLVRSGDTAMSIARDNQPDGVSLEQMLAALYRDNPQAFAGNINRLRAGVPVRIPAAATAQAIDAGESRRIVAQSSNFSSYRERIARDAGSVPSTGTNGQQASGKLTTRVEDGAAPSADLQDRLQLSRPGTGNRPANAPAGTRGGLGASSTEDLAAKDRELVETKSRLALLEKNVADLQQLLALKNQSLADLQKGGSAAGAVVPAPAPVAPAPATPLPAPAPAPAAVVAPPAPPPVVAAPAVVTPPVATTAPAPATDPAKGTPAMTKAAPASTPVASEDWLDTVKDNALLLVGLLVVLALIGYGLMTARRRRQLAGFEDSIFVDNSVLHANSVFGTTGGQSVDTANSGFHSNFVPVAGLAEQSEVDPVAEADVYIAYGRDAQAEEILKEALRSDPSRHAVRLKLLEIYVKRGDAKTFETVASELYAATGGQGDDWKAAAALGRGLDPQNPLYSDVADAPAPALVTAPAPVPRPVATPPARPSSPPPSSIGVPTAVAAGGLLDSTFDFRTSIHPDSEAPATATDLLRTDPLPRAEPPRATSDPSMDLDFDLGFAKADAAPPPLAPAEAPYEPLMSDFDTKPLADPFTASAFTTMTDISAHAAVNLNALRGKAADGAPSGADRASESDIEGFSASDIFGSSLIIDDDAPEPKGAANGAPAPTPDPVNKADGQVVDSSQFAKTEPLEAFSNINLELDDPAGRDATPDFSAAGTDIWQAMATKLDLALAYSDIGDKDGARELLDEVVRSGDAAQADRARQLISELG